VPLGEQRQLIAWQAAPLTELIRHLVGTHHQECREDMSRLETLLALTAMEPGPSRLALVELRDLFAQFCTELRSHLAREERDLFPVVLDMEKGMTPGIGKEHMGLMRSLLEEEHIQETELLRDIKVLTASLATVHSADCPLVLLNASLAGLSARFQEHLELEDQVLFPRMG